MPGKIKVKVLAGRNLPVMDRASDTTDAFVEIKFGGVTHKTDVCRKSLNPHWNSTEWYRFEVDESELQDEPLQLRLMDHDTYSANDAIGKVVISLAPLLAREANEIKSTAAPHGSAVMSGWIPVFDTMHGIRGELNVIVKVELFSDFNKYKTSSCGVQFFHCPRIPPGYRASAIHGFVEELVVNDDPEYQWIDKIRTPRSSNEARQVAFIKLSNQVQRLVGLKAAELGANAVVGYQQDFDLEGEAGVVARAVGTAVSITPVPTHSQQANMPPCTQQQLKKYLDILATDNDNVTDLNEYYQTHQEELQKLLIILNPNAPSLLDGPVDDEDDKSPDITRQSSTSTYAGNISLYQNDYVSHKSLKHISEDQTELNRLLNKRDDYDSDSSGPLQKIKKLKTNFFAKRFSLRSRKSDKDFDQISLKSNSSENSRISLGDIRCEFKKLKRLKKPKFIKIVPNKEDEGEGMASILARSVLHAHTSLACINESQDSEHSPGSTLRRTSESEPTICISDDEKTKNPSPEVSGDVISEESVKRVPEIHFQSLINISSEVVTPQRERTISESCPTSPIVGRNDNLLKLPGETGYYGSISSALSADSSEMYSSSEEDDESSDIKTDTDRSIETTSSVVRSVLNHEVDPAIVAQMNKKLSILERATPEPREINQKDYIEKCKSVDSLLHGMQNVKNNKTGVMKHEASTSTRDLNMCVKKAHSHNIKFHNPFSHKKASQSISAPSSPTEKAGFVYRSSKRIKNQLSKISKSSMIKSLSHYSLLPKKKQAMKTLSRPNSSSDVISKTPSETVLGYHFLSYSDLLSLDKEGFGAQKKIHKSDEFSQSKFSMYIGSEPVSRASLSCPSSPPHKHDHDHHVNKKEKSVLKSIGLVHTAMETMLIDRVQSLLIPTLSDHVSSNTKQFFTDVSEKLQKVKGSRNNQSFIGTDDVPSSHKPQPMPHEGPQIVSMKPKPFIGDYKNNSHKDGKCKSHKPTGLVHTAMETILMEKVQNLMGPTTPELNKSVPYFEKSGNKTITSQDVYTKASVNLVHAADKTILLDKVQAALPGTSGPLPVKSESLNLVNKDDNAHASRSTFSRNKPTGLVETAVKTIIMDKIQSLCGSITPHSIPEQIEHKSDTNKKNEQKESTGLVHTAMKTILADKVQSLISPQTCELNQKIEFTSTIKLEEQEEKNETLKSPGLVNAAMETMLLDRVQTLIGPQRFETDAKLNCDYLENNDKTIQSEEIIKIEESSGLEQTTTEALPLKTSNHGNPLIDNNVNRVKNVENTSVIPKKEDTGLIKTSVETLHEDKVSSLVCVKKSTFTTKEPENVKSLTGDISSSTNNPSIEIIKMYDVDTTTATTTRNGNLDKQKDKKLVRQDSIHSVAESLKTSNENLSNVSYKITKPMLQHFHPVLSGAQLETIPSLPESSLDHTESLDVEGVETNNIGVSVCGNSHAVCDVGRSERDRDKCEKDKGSPRHARHESYGGREPTLQAAHAQNSSLNASSTPMGIHRRSSDSDLSVTPKGSSLNMSAGNVGTGGGAILRPSMNSNNLDMLEYPFLTMTEFPPGFIVHIGGTVCARSVKLVDSGGVGGGAGGGESGARALWWAELRTELRAHARALRCNAVISYLDTTAICEDVCVLSASGTAAVINLDCDFNAELDPIGSSGSKNAIDEVEVDACSVAHVPYSPGSGPYRAELSTCGGCRRARVPAVLLATCAKPNRLISYAKAVTLTAVAARVRRAPPAAEPGARDISDQLPFLEYELHKLLLAKLRMQGANALFSLQTQIAIGERCVMALASGTAFRLAALPPPTPPRIKALDNDKEALEIQKALWDSFTANKAANGYDIASDHSTNGVLPEIEGDDAPVLDLCADKDACVLELDEAEDVETARALAVRRVLPPVYSSNLKPLRGAPPHAFAQVWRGRIAGAGGVAGAGSAAAERHVSRALHSVAYKLRRLSPCALAATRFQLDLPEDEIQLVVSGTAIPLQDPSKPEHSSENGENGAGNGCGDADDDIFALDEEQLVKSSRETEVEEKPCINGQTAQASMVSLTTLSGVSGARAVRRVCALRLLFVRETTTVRELGGLSGFLHTFTCEVLAIARAYTAALGGNALTSFYVTQLMLQDNAHKNQGQCLLSVGGDVVNMTY